MALTLSWQHMTYKPSKLDQTDLFLSVCDQSSSVWRTTKNLVNNNSSNSNNDRRRRIARLSGDARVLFFFQRLSVVV